MNAATKKKRLHTTPELIDARVKKTWEQINNIKKERPLITSWTWPNACVIKQEQRHQMQFQSRKKITFKEPHHHYLQIDSPMSAHLYYYLRS